MCVFSLQLHVYISVWVGFVLEGVLSAVKRRNLTTTKYIGFSFGCIYFKAAYDEEMIQANVQLQLIQ